MNPLQSVKVQNVTPPQAIVDNNSWTTGEIDTKDWDYCTILCAFGAMDIAMVALKVQESDTSGSGFADATGLVYGTSANIAGSTSALPTSTSDNTVFRFDVDCKKSKRYLDVVATGGDGTAGTFLTVVAILSRGRIHPDTAAEAGCADILRT